MEISKIPKLDQDWLDKVSREAEEWDPLEGIGDEHNDKSQDTDWLRGGFLARGAEIDEMQQRIYKLLAAYSAHEISIDELKLHKAWYRALFGITFGITLGMLLVRLFA